MKLIIAMIQPHKLPDVKKALYDSEVFKKLIAKIINQSQLSGNFKYSSLGYIWAGIILCCLQNQIDKGYDLGITALQLNEMFNEKMLEGKLYYLFGAFLSPLKQTNNDEFYFLKSLILSRVFFQSSVSLHFPQ